jgi:mRNA-degrading endonuclease YafQ of YafQ-DinJ toxin-antitoxin module
MPPCAIDFTNRFSSQVRALPREQREELDLVLQRLGAAFGQPHAHSGLGIRRLRGDYFECRLGRDLRVVFKLEGSTLTMAALGSHDDVRRFIKSR